MFTQQKNEPIATMSVSYRGALQKAEKSSDKLAPVFEAVTNSLEAIEGSAKTNSSGRIVLRICRRGLSPELASFDSIEVEDDGRGFTEEDFQRFLTLDDTSKGRNNKGTGRLQYVLSFEETKFSSYFSQKGQMFERLFAASMKDSFLEKNSIVSGGVPSPVVSRSSGTIVSFHNVRNQKDKEFFEKLTINELKSRLLERYLVKFHQIRKKLPQIILEEVVEVQEKTTINQVEITTEDIPQPIFERPVEFHYDKFERSKKSKVTVEQGSKSVDATIAVFSLNAEDKSSQNKIEFVSKGETVGEASFGLLKKDDKIDGKRFVVYVSGEFIDDHVGDARSSFKLPTEKDVKKTVKYNVGDMLREDGEYLTMDSVLFVTRRVCAEALPMLSDVEQRLKERLRTLQKIYLFNDSVLTNLVRRLSLDDSDRDILRKVYQYESTNDAQFDEKIQRKLEEVGKLNPSCEQYVEELNKLTDRVVQEIPQRNRASLTKHIFRRSVVLKLFEMTLNNQLEVQKRGGKINEGRLHDLIFPRKSSDPYQSDLWILNEEYVYFNGTSDKPFRLIEANGKRIFDDNLPQDQWDYLHSYGKKRENQRPDILLFPEENKCIIVELKQPDVDVSEHLDQITNYATFLRNFTKNEFQFDKFYGYLIGENFSMEDVTFHRADFIESETFEFAFHPSMRISGKKGGRSDGSLYMEITKYSSILKRAKKRHMLFDEILTRKFTEGTDLEK